MSVFPGNVLVIDDQFNLGYQTSEPEDLSQIVQWKNFRRLRNLFDANGFCYAAITETRDIGDIVSKIKKYQNIRLLLLDLDLDESGDVEDGDIEMVKKIVLASLNIFGYYFLAINSSYSEKWDEIKADLLKDLSEDEIKNKKKIHFLNNFCIALNKTNDAIEEQILKLLSDKFSHELITQFEAGLNDARDKALSPFMEFANETWEHIYNMLKEDMDSKEHINLTLNSFLFGLLRQHMVGLNYSVPIEKGKAVDPDFQQSIIRNFNYLQNNSNQLDKHPIWTGNIYCETSESSEEKYLLIITPECDIAQAKGSGYTVIKGFDYKLPKDYKPADLVNATSIPISIRLAGKKSDGTWKSANEVKDFCFKSQGFYALLHAGKQNEHLIFDLRSAFRIGELPKKDYGLMLRVNEPIITDIMDRFAAIYNRKGIPRLTSKKYV